MLRNIFIFNGIKMMEICAKFWCCWWNGNCLLLGSMARSVPITSNIYPENWYKIWKVPFYDVCIQQWFQNICRVWVFDFCVCWKCRMISSKSECRFHTNRLKIKKKWKLCWQFRPKRCAYTFYIVVKTWIPLLKSPA